MSNFIDDLRATKQQKEARETEILSAAAGRTMAAEEKTELEQVQAEIAGLTDEISLRERAEARQAEMAKPQRKSTPALGRQVITAVKPQLPKDLGGYLMAVKDAQFDPNAHRYLTDLGVAHRADRSMAATVYNTEGTTANDTGYMVPNEYLKTLDRTSFAENSLAARCRVIPASGPAIFIPISNKTPYAPFSGTGKGGFKGEGVAADTVKVETSQLQVNIATFTAIGNVTYQAVQDNPGIGTYMLDMMLEDLNYQVDGKVLNGTATSTTDMAGILASSGCLSVSGTDHVSGSAPTVKDLKKAYYALAPQFRGNAVWVISPDVEEGLMDLGWTGASGSTPVYLPAENNISNAPRGTLLGRPVVVNTQAKALGTKGHTSLIDFSQYYLADRDGIRFEDSIHLFFDQNLQTWKIWRRLGGVPRYSAGIQVSAAKTYGAYVTIAA